MPEISIIIPNRETENPYETLKSLKNQMKNCEIIIVYDEGKGANWARNRGAELAKGSYLLFSDNDVIWEHDALTNLYYTLIHDKLGASYCYGWYAMDDLEYCRQEFSQGLLYKHNYISTMTMIKKGVFPGFDESLQRLQDWDLWLTLLTKGFHGVYCPHKIFTTKKREGITYGNGIPWEEARDIVLTKHGLKNARIQIKA